MGEIWKAVIGLLVTGGPLLAVQLGGRRGLMRRAIREELELLRLLDNAEHTAVRERLQRRVATRLEQYEPGEGAKRRRRRGRQLAAGEFAVLMIVAVTILEVFEVASAGVSLAIGAALGAVGAVVHSLIASRLDKREQDEAVAEVRLEGVRRSVEAHFEVRAKPGQPARDE